MNENEVKSTLDRELDSAVNSSESKPQYRKRRSARRGFPYFYAIYGAVVAVALIAIICVCSYINVLLVEYEQVQPKYKADEIFLEHFKNPDVDALMSYADESFGEFEPREVVIAHIKEQLDGSEITYSETMKGKDGERTYSVYSDGKRFAFFTLAEGDTATEHGFKYYELSDIKLQYKLSDSKYTFLLPDRYTLYVNGIAVSDKYKTGESVSSDSYKITGGKIGANYVEYIIDGLMTSPTEETFALKDESGADASIYWDEENELYSVDTDSVTVRVPVGYTLYLNESVVSDDYKNSEKEPQASAYNTFLADAETGIYYIEYNIGGFYSDSVPVVTVKNADGVECAVNCVDDGVYESAPVYSVELGETYGDSIKEFFRQYTLYLMYVNITADGEPTDYIKKADLKPYFDTSSKVWKAFNSIQVSWQFEPKRYEFTDETVDEFIEYPDGTFSCRIRHNYNSWRGSATYSTSVDKIVFYKISGSKILIYDMANSNSVQGIGAPTVEE